MDDLNIIFTIPVFRNFSDEMRKQALEILDYRIDLFSKGETIIRQGQTCRYLHILMQGKMYVDVEDISGNKVRMETINAPRTFATPHIFSEKNCFPASFTVIEPVTLLRATKESVFKLMHTIPQFLSNFLCVSANCNKCTMARLRVLSFRGIRNRLISYLMDREKNHANEISIEHNITQLADYLGVTRPALSTEISKLESEGVITVLPNKIVKVASNVHLSKFLCS